MYLWYNVAFFYDYRYMGPMSRDTAAERLKIQPNGTFLVRDSENPARRGFPALSIK